MQSENVTVARNVKTYSTEDTQGFGDVVSFPDHNTVVWAWDWEGKPGAFYYMQATKTAVHGKTVVCGNAYI